MASPRGGLVLLVLLIATTQSAVAAVMPSDSAVFVLLHKTRGGVSAPSSSGFPFFPPSTTTTTTPRPGKSSMPTHQQQQQLWGSEHFDARPLVLEPRSVDNLKSRDSRVGLIRKIYATLGVQLFMTAAVTFAFFQYPQAVQFLLSPQGSWIVMLCMGVSLGSAVALGMRYSRVFPTNLGLLSLFTAGESVLIGLITSRYKADAVLLAALQTGAAVTGLSLFAFRKNKKYDLTAFGSTLFSGLLILFVSTLLATFFGMRLPDVVTGGFGALLFSAFLIYDTQRIVGGGETQLDDKDWVLGALDLYIDITRMFLYLLRILASENSRE